MQVKGSASVGVGHGRVLTGDAAVAEMAGEVAGLSGRRAAGSAVEAARLSELSTAALVALAKGGSREAFDPLYRRYSGEILRYVLRKVDGNRPLAEDIAGQTWVTAMANIAQLDARDGDDRAFVRWLYGITKRSSMRGTAYAWRERASSDYMSFWAEDACRFSTLGESTSVDDRPQLQRMRDAVASALETLPRRQYEVARMRLDGLTVEEIADRLSLDVSQVRTAWENAFGNVRRMLAPSVDAVVAGECRPIVRSTKRMTLPAKFDREGFRAAAASLPPVARRIALLKLERHSNAEIAEILGCPVNTVKFAWHRACLAFAEHGLMAKAAPVVEPVTEVAPEDALRAAVEALPTATKRIVQLRLDGLTHAAIAEAIGRTAGTVGATLWRARRILAGQGFALAV